jgi:hypothetical protein
MTQVPLDTFRMSSFGDQERRASVSEIVHAKAIRQPSFKDGRLPDTSGEVAVPQWLPCLWVARPVAVSLRREHESVRQRSDMLRQVVVEQITDRRWNTNEAAPVVLGRSEKEVAPNFGD